MTPTNNLFADLPAATPDELIEVLAASEAVRIERIISSGHSSPEGHWYDQAEHEFVLVSRGAARIQFEDSVVEMLPGDWLVIPAHRKHRVAWTTPDETTIWLAVFYKT